MHVLDGLEELVDNEPLVDVLENVRANHCVKIRFCHKIRLREKREKNGRRCEEWGAGKARCPFMENQATYNKII